MTWDVQSLNRQAMPLFVEVRRFRGSPPNYEFNWQPLWNALVDRLEINVGKTPSTATIWFPGLRWEWSLGLTWGDMIRIRSAEPNFSVLFIGIITNFLSDFSGGDGNSAGYEHSAFFCQSSRWLLAVTSSLFGQLAYNKDNKLVFLSGRRMIFNEDGRPNKAYGGADFDVFEEPSRAEYWTAKWMIKYLFDFCNGASWYWSNYNIPIHPDWDKVLNHIVVEGLNIIEAIDRIAGQLGWSFREDYFHNGYVTLTFFKQGVPSSGIFRHWLHAPAVGENVAAAVAQGRKLICQMSLTEDISGIINTPIGLGGIAKFEITANLVPAWSDYHLVPDTSKAMANLYLTNAELQDIDDKNSVLYYKFYHKSGANFDLYRDVGRRWSLNETGKYSQPIYNNRPGPFDFTMVIPAGYLGNYGLFARQLLGCLTTEAEDSEDSVGIKVEFSFDFGATWQALSAGISLLKDEAGIYIDADNLCELSDKEERDITSGNLKDEPLNYWTSLCDDVLNSRQFPDWRTRVRVTASIQMDQRLWTRPNRNAAATISPFEQEAVFDHSEKYKIQLRTQSSQFFNSLLPAENIDKTPLLTSHLLSLRQANEELSVSGRFVLERLWTGDGSGFPTFVVGDLVERITGRNYALGTTWSGVGFPEIVQIVYLPDKQKMILLTRDLRFGDVGAAET